MDFLKEQILNISKAGAYDAIAPEYSRLKDENERIKRLLHDLTPGGSEFYNDPEYCAKWIRENRQENHYTLAGLVKELKTENTKLKDRVKFLEELINEYTLKMKANLSGGKVDSFLKDQVNPQWSELEQEIEQEGKDHDERNDIKNVL